MNMTKPRSSRTRRRTAFAAPFVVTALLVPGCGGKAKPPDGPDPTTTTTTTTTDVGPAPTGDGAWGQEDEVWVFAYANGDKVFYGADNQCRLQEADHCHDGGDMTPRVTDCNPPPPRDVACPAGLPADAKPAP